MQSDEKSSTLTIRIDPFLRDWAKWFAKKNHTTVTHLIVSHFKELKDIYEKDDCEDDAPQM